MQSIMKEKHNNDDDDEKKKINVKAINIQFIRYLSME